MPPETLAREALTRDVWKQAQQELAVARREVATAPAGVVRQARYDRMLASERHSTALVHGWLGRAFEIEPVQNPRLVLALDVDGVLEDESQEFSCTGLPGAAALKLLEVGRVAVLLNTARSLTEVRIRTEQFNLLGGVSAFGGALWDGVFAREYWLLSDRAAAQLAALRSAVRADPSLVIDSAYDCSLRLSRIVNGTPGPIVGPEARRLLDRLGLHDLTFWVAPRHTDFVDRSVDKALGFKRLQRELGLESMPVAAMGDAACDLPMLRLARFAFLPAATLPSYTAQRGQRLLRCRGLGDQALWEAACYLVPDVALQRRVLSVVERIDMPDWVPTGLRRLPAHSKRLFPKIAAVFGSMHRTN